MDSRNTRAKDDEIVALYRSLRVPMELERDATDSVKAAEAKKVTRKRFRSLYADIISSHTLRDAAQHLSKSMKNNMFVSIFDGIDGYYSFDNPSSRQYVSEIHALGALTFNSDIFYDEKPSLNPQFAESMYAGGRGGVSQLQHPGVPHIYSSETQYGYVLAFVHTDIASRIHRIAHKLPELTSVVRITKDRAVTCHTRHTAPDPNPPVVGEVVNKTVSLYQQKSAPPFYTKMFGTHGDTMSDFHDTISGVARENLPPHLYQQLQSYDIIEVADNDYGAQKRNKHRAFKTFISILKALNK